MPKVPPSVPVIVRPVFAVAPATYEPVVSVPRATASAPIVVEIAVLPDPKISPDKVIDWFPVKYVFVSINKAPVPPLVLTKPLVVRFESVEIFCEVLTVTVFVERVSPVENVSGTSYADVLVKAAVPKVPPPAMLSVDPSVPARVSVFEAVRVFPFTTVKVPVEGVIVRPLTVVGVIAPRVNVSTPAVFVAETPFAVETEFTRVPFVGKVTFVAPVVVRVSAFTPEVVNAPAVETFPPRVIVFAPLLTPVPPFAWDSIPATSAVARSIALVIDPDPTKSDEVNVSETNASIRAVPFQVPVVMTPVFGVMTSPLNPVALVMAPVSKSDVPVAAPIFGVTSVGEVAKTVAPVPVSSVKAAAKLALDGVPRNVATPVPKAERPVPPFAIGNSPVTLVARSIVPLVMSAFSMRLEESNPADEFLTIPAVVNREMIGTDENVFAPAIV
jgi:hypothetical protein